MSEQMTCVFNFDVREYDGNPLHAETPFGKPTIVSRGNLADDFDRMEARANEAMRLLREVKITMEALLFDPDDPEIGAEDWPVNTWSDGECLNIAFKDIRAFLEDK